MKVLLWEFDEHWAYIVLWDGENTYWIEEMRPSNGYKDLGKRIGKIEDRQRYTLIGDL